MRVLQGGPTGNLDDIEHFQNRLITALGVAKSLLGLERDQGAKANTGQIIAAWAKSMQRLSQIVTRDAIGETLRRAAIIEGVDPSKAKWRVAMAEVSSMNRARNLSNQALEAEIATALLNAGLVTKKYALENVLRVAPDVSDELLRDIESDAMPIAPEPQSPLPKPRNLTEDRLSRLSRSGKRHNLVRGGNRTSELQLNVLGRSFNVGVGRLGSCHENFIPIRRHELILNTTDSRPACNSCTSVLFYAPRCEFRALRSPWFALGPQNSPDVGPT